MTSSASNSPPPVPRSGQSAPVMPPLPTDADPRVQEFWQRAQAVVASEHGLTPLCQVKLATFAHEMGLTDDEFQQTLTRLSNSSEPVAPPSLNDQQAAKFREYVDRKVAKLAGSMLDMSREQHWLEVARDRYALDEAAAHKVVEAVAAERGVRRITRDEAAQIVADMVAEKVGDAVWIDHASAKRVIVAGQVWGLSALEIDQLIRAQTKANRERLASERLRSRLLIGTAGVTAVGLAILVFWLASSRRHPPSDDMISDTDATTGGAATAPTPTRRATAPNWWDARLAVAVSHARSWHRSFRALVEGLASDDAARRGEAYERVVGWSSEPSESDDAEQPPAPLARDILVGAYAADPADDAARRLREALVAPVAETCQRGPRKAIDVRRATWSIETALQGAARATSNGTRSTAVLAALATPLEIHFDSDRPASEWRQQAFAAYSRIVLRHVARRASDDPRMALELHDAIREAAAHLPTEEFQRLQVSVVVAALPAAGDHWMEWRPILSECASSSGEPLGLVPLIELYERAGQATWRDPLGALLRSRAGIRKDPGDPAAVARAVREGLGLVAGSSSGLPLDAWNQLRGPAEAALARATAPTNDPTELLERVVELAHWATVAEAASHGDAGRHVWENAWRDGPPTLSAVQPAARAAVNRDVPIFASPAPSPKPFLDSRTQTLRRASLHRMINSLEHFERLEPVHRIRFIKEIATLSGDVTDVTASQGQHLARYLLAERPEPEMREVSDSSRVVLAWKQVQLGVADFLAGSRLPNVVIVQLMSHLLGRGVSEDEASNSRTKLRRELLARVLAHMSEPLLVGDASSDLAARADEAAVALQSLFVKRASLDGIDAGKLPADPSPGLAAAALAQQLATRQLAAGQLSDLDRRWLAEFSSHAAIADFQSTTDLHRLVAWERLLVRLSANELAKLHPDQAAAAAVLVSRSLDQPPRTKQLLEQLVQLESLQLRLWMLPGGGSAAAPTREASR